jgi:hypothetical protein
VWPPFKLGDSSDNGTRSLDARIKITTEMTIRVTDLVRVRALAQEWRCSIGDAMAELISYGLDG